MFSRIASGIMFYAVRVGRRVGVYNSWEECKEQTKGFPGATYKQFRTNQEALQFAFPPPVAPSPAPTTQPFHHFSTQTKRKTSNNRAAPTKKIKLGSPEEPTEPKNPKKRQKDSEPDNNNNSISETKPDVDPVATEPPSELKLNYSNLQLSPVKQSHIDYLKIHIPYITACKIAELLDIHENLVVTYLNSTPQDHLQHQDTNLQDSNQLVVYTDGACQGNGTDAALAGIGVWFGPNDPRNISEKLHGELQTNQRAELTAAIRCLQKIKETTPGLTDVRPVIHSDSIYVIKGITEWIRAWKKKNWKNAKGEAVKNQDLWALLDQLTQGMTIQWVHVKGHSGNFGNDQADALAVAGCTLGE